MAEERRLLKAAFKKASTWGTAVAVGANDGLLILEDGGLKKTRDYLPAKESDSPFVGESVLGRIAPVDFAPTMHLRYEGLEVLLAMVMGTAGAPTQPDAIGAPNTYEHTLQLADAIKGLFGTFCIEKGSKIHEVPSAKSHRLVFSIADGILQLEVGIRGNDLIDNSTTNTDLSAVTYLEKHHRVLFKQGVFRMNNQSAAALANSDKIYPNDFTLTIERFLDEAYEAGSDKIIEPLENDHPSIILTLSFPRINSVNEAYFQDFDAETLKKMDITFTGALIEATYYYELKFQLPQLKIVDVEYTWSEIIPASITLQAEQADSAPSGMTGITKPVQIDLRNTRNTDPLT